MRLRNQHTSAIDGVKRGEVGDFDEKNPAIAAMRKAGHLVPVDGAGREESDEGPITEGERASFDRFAREKADELAAKDARITELEVEAAQLRLGLEAATAPKGDAEKPARARKD
ncbi:MAG: hypothetical protein IPF99_24395 [Deltaproteobacteria bacterium]|jgi:hypothetical protein|nr:hypothetical protein [Deltaproteobacteria bacterium]MBP6829480.1 hypothetical protein [Deltaproteobacteria bacterium]